MVLGCCLTKLTWLQQLFECIQPCQTEAMQMQAMKLLMTAQDSQHTKVVELKHANDAAVDVQAEEGRKTRVEQAAFEQTQGLRCQIL